MIEWMCRADYPKRNNFNECVPMCFEREHN